jgi:hypothetical protein
VANSVRYCHYSGVLLGASCDSQAARIQLDRLTLNLDQLIYGD